MNAYADSLMLLYVAAALGGVGAGAVYGTCVGNALKWFPDRRGLAAGLTAGGGRRGIGPHDPSDIGDDQIERVRVHFSVFWNRPGDRGRGAVPDIDRAEERRGSRDLEETSADAPPIPADGRPETAGFLGDVCDVRASWGRRAHGHRPAR